MTATLPGILLPLRFRRRRQRIVALRRAGIAQMIVAQILVRWHLAEAAHAHVPASAFVHRSPRRIVEHRYGCSTEYDSVFRGRGRSMIRVRRAADRGHFDHGWLDTYHTFSFADYHDPDIMGFRSLRVINDDRVEPGRGFGMHGHRHMEIITYLLEGQLGHADSMGTGSV